MATKITCRAINCIFNEAERCTAMAIIYDPDEGCLTYEALQEDIFDLDEDEEAWEENELLVADENEGLGWDDADLWGEEDEEELNDEAENDDW